MLLSCGLRVFCSKTCGDVVSWYGVRRGVAAGGESVLDANRAVLGNSASCVTRSSAGVLILVNG